MSNASSTYENLASKLLIISPVLASISMNTETFVKHRELLSCLLMLNEINNGFIELNVDECERIGFPVIMPAPSLLPRIERFEAFIKERERLLTSVEENKMLYLTLVHVRKSHEKNWATKFSVRVH